MDYTELYKYMNHLFSTYFYTYRLDEDEKNDAIQDCILKILQKEQSGVLQNSIDKNKNYIFITLKNYLIYHNQQKFKKKSMELDGDVIAYYDVNLEEDLNKEYELKYITDYLSTSKTSGNIKLVIQRILKGDTFEEIADDLELSITQVKHKYYWFIRQIRKTPRYKYRVIFNDGTERLLEKKKNLLKVIKMSPDTFDAFKELNKTQFKEYKIEFLT